PHCGEAFTVDESGYAAILNQVRDQEFQREVDARVSLAEKSREQEVALAVTKAEEALRAQIAERDGELVNLKAQLSVQQQQASMETQIAVQRAEAAAKDAQGPSSASGTICAAKWSGRATSWRRRRPAPRPSCPGSGRG
ncbi:MAG: hypothetical protein ACLUE1_01340, partial [Adlercreutzia equolifaciens]